MPRQVRQFSGSVASRGGKDSKGQDNKGGASPAQLYRCLDDDAVLPASATTLLSPGVAGTLPAGLAICLQREAS